MKKTECRLIVFAKAPIPGKVKTRLLPFLDGKTTSIIHEQLVLHCLNTATEAAVGKVDLWCSPMTQHPFFKRCAKKFKVELYQQTEGDLGKRMSCAFYETLKKSDGALLIGTDCPALTCDDLKEAKKILHQGAQAVIGPSEDGGYVLIGLRQYESRLFEGISWGTGAVMEETRKKLRRLKWLWHELPQRWDVDRLEDVERLRREGFSHIIPL
jgi:rSAM/selenodomain-associated transferase 1